LGLSVRRQTSNVASLITVVLELLLAPALVGVSTYAASRWDDRVGGVISAFPAIVGPLLLVGATTHGSDFAARAATGVLIGLVSLSGFVVAYARVSRRCAWPRAFVAGWAVATILSLVSNAVAVAWGAALVLALVSLIVAYWTMPRTLMASTGQDSVRLGVLARMGTAAVLIAALSAAADRLGPAVGGLLAALPILASILACATHREYGSAAATDLLRGMVTGLVGFAIFCAIVAALVVPMGIASAFGLALVGACASQLGALSLGRRAPVAWSAEHC
jgi:hypothetical protein